MHSGRQCLMGMCGFLVTSVHVVSVSGSCISGVD